MNFHVRNILAAAWWTPTAHEVVRVLAMNYLHVMPAFGEFMRQLLNKYGVAAEVVGRIERCHHTKAHQVFQSSYSNAVAADN
jgi:hypothetical protein